MVGAVVFVPSPPFLLAALGGGLADLRASCREAVTALDGCGEVVVVATGPVDGWATGPIDATPYGAPGAAAVDALPLGLAVGATLLGDREFRLCAVAAGELPDLPGDVGLLVVGDGPARRSEKAPGHLDPRSRDLDEVVERALLAGDPEQLLAVDPGLAAELLMAGLPVWRAVARALLRDRPGPDAWTTRLLSSTAPYGVAYLVATWQRDPDRLRRAGQPAPSV